MPSDEQIAQRIKFSRACKCFNRQTHTGGATPPALGPRNRSWWYDQSAGSGLFYFDYFMQQTLNAFSLSDSADWCCDMAGLMKSYYVENNSFYEKFIPGANIWRGKDSTDIKTLQPADPNKKIQVCLQRITLPSGHAISTILHSYSYPDPADLIIIPLNNTINISNATWTNTIDHLSGIQTISLKTSYDDYVIDLRQMPVNNNTVSWLLALNIGTKNNAATGMSEFWPIIYEPD